MDLQTVISNKNHSNVLSIVGIVMGILAIPLPGIVFVPLSILCSVLAILKKDQTNIILGIIGLIMAFVGICYSPTLWLMFIR